MAVSKAKARKILRHGMIHGKPLTEKQKNYFGLIAGGGTPKRSKKKMKKGKKKRRRGSKKY